MKFYKNKYIIDWWNLPVSLLKAHALVANAYALLIYILVKSTCRVDCLKYHIFGILHFTFHFLLSWFLIICFFYHLSSIRFWNTKDHFDWVDTLLPLSFLQDNLNNLIGLDGFTEKKVIITFAINDLHIRCRIRTCHNPQYC